MPITVNEKSTSVITGVYTDEAGDPIGSDRMEAIICSIMLKGDETQTHRSSDDLLDDENYTLGLDGAYTHALQPSETELFDLQLTRGGSETHTIALRFVWDSERSGTLTNPINTTDGDVEFDVDFPSHGLSVRDAIVLHPALLVGGLDVGGVFVVRATPDADTVTLESKSPATATATGGGSTRYWVNPMTDVAQIDLKVRSVDLQ